MRKNIFLFMMKLVIIFIILSNFKSTYESFSNHEKTSSRKLIFLGDSMFRNDSYVPGKNSVYANLVQEFGENNIKIFAKDGATIQMMPFQTEMMMNDGITPENGYVKLLDREKNNTPNIFISFGGNDIIYYFVKKKGNKSVESLFKDYKRNVSSIQNKYPQAKIYLATVYYPQDPPYNNFKNVISEWNNNVTLYAKQNNMKILPVDKYLTKPSDFVYKIEPSVTGGKKIVKCVKNVI